MKAVIQKLLMGCVIGVGLSVATQGLASESLQQQEAERLGRERQSFDRENQSLAKRRAAIESEKKELGSVQSKLDGKKLALVIKTKQFVNYRDGWRCPQGLTFAECTTHPEAKRAFLNELNRRQFELRLEVEAAQREERAFNVRRNQFLEQVNNFNYRQNDFNARLKRYNSDLADYGRRYPAGTGAATGGRIGVESGGYLTFDESAPKKK